MLWDGLCSECSLLWSGLCYGMGYVGVQIVGMLCYRELVKLVINVANE